MRKLMLVTPILYMILFYGWMYLFQENQLLNRRGLNLFPIIAATFCLLIFLRNTILFQGKQRVFWLLYCCGTLCFIIAQCIWLYDQWNWHGSASYPAESDLFWLMQYALYLTALIYQLTMLRGIMGVRSLFNIIIFMVTFGILSFHFLIEPMLQKNEAIPALIITLSYPIFDLGFLFAAVSLYFHSQRSVHRKMILIISLGIFIQVIADVLHYYYQSNNTYQPNSFIDPLWMVPILLNGAAGLYVRQHVRDFWTEIKPNVFKEKANDLLPYASVIVLMVVILVNTQHNEEWLLIGLLVVMLLIAISQILIIMSNRNLLLALHLKNEELETSETRYRQLVEILPVGITIEVEGKLVLVNKAGMEMLGASSPEEILGRSAASLVHEEYTDIIKQRHREASAGNIVVKPFEFAVRRLDGKMIDVESTLTQIKYNCSSGFLIVAQDITKRKQNENNIKTMAYYDSLTGLPNRARFYEQLNIEIENAKIHQHLLAVMYMDLDRFKLINDSMGHSVGDLFLTMVAERVNGIQELKGKLYRLGGDEFCLIINTTNQEGAGDIAQMILDEFSAPFTLKDSEYYTSPSIGISMYPLDGTGSEDLVRVADIAMYNVKKSGGKNYQFYNRILEQDNSNTLDIEKTLRKAILNKEFVLYYQPKVDLIKGGVIGVEALIRWQHPNKGIIPPLDFIPTAEETGLIVPIGIWVLEEACLQMKRWHDAGMEKLSIAVNISPRQFSDRNLIGNVERILQETGLDPRCLEIEITETVMQNIHETTMLLYELKKLGVQISIDDFGTGYSSLSYLKYLPIDYLKIDKSFVRDITENSKDEAIIQTIVDMGHHMKIEIVAEGIENEQQLISLVNLRCNVGQGYLFSKPLPANEIELLFG
ncbi:DUF4084 domain-containing protein [Paenibacillus sp. Z3-2]